MPPKAKREQDELEQHVQQPPKLTLADIQATWQERHIGEYFSRILVNEIVAEMEQEIVRAHMDHTSVPWTVQSVVTDVMESLTLNFIEREDFGFDLSESDPPDVEVHVAEPQTPNADAWARATIPQRTPLIRPDSEQFASSKPPPPRERDRRPQQQQSSPAAPPRASFAFSPEVGESERAGLSTSMNVARREPHHPERSGGKAKVPPPATTEPAGGAGSPSTGEGPPPATNDETIVLTAEERRLLEVNRKSSERMQSLRAAAEKLNKQFHDLRNAPGTLVVDGATNTVVVVTKPESRKMSARLEPKVQWPDEAAAAATTSTAKKGGVGKVSSSLTPSALKSSTKPANATTTSPENSPKKPKGDPSTFWHPEQQTSPMILGVTPVGGVQSKEGEVVRRNELKQQKSRISRGEYNKMLVMQQQSRLTAGAEPLFDPHTTAEAPQPGGLTSVASARQLVSQGSFLGKSVTGLGDTANKPPPQTPPPGEGGSGVIKASAQQLKAQPEKAKEGVGRKDSAPKMRSPGRRRSSGREREKHHGEPLLPDPEQLAKIPRASTPRKAARVNPLHVARAASATPAGGLKDIIDRARAITPTLEAAARYRYNRPQSSQSENADGKRLPGRTEGIVVMGDPSALGLGDDDFARDRDFILGVSHSQLSYPSFGATLSLGGSL